MKLLVFDNYDSFTYNLVHAFRHLGVFPEVIRNDRMEATDASKYDKIVISPGPGIPEEAGILPELLKTWWESKPILGVCLGHQALGETFGAKLKNLSDVYHGIATDIQVKASNDYLFEGLPERFKVGRYHSWVIDPEHFPHDKLEITAEDDNGQIMAIRHLEKDIRGVQFHPESILTPQGIKILKNWLEH